MTRSTHPARPLDDLLADVEHAFEEGRGSERAHDLAETYPEHAEPLVDFVDAMLRAALAPSPDPVASARTTAALADRLDARSRPDLATGVREAGDLLTVDASVPPTDVPDTESATPGHDVGCTVYSLPVRPGHDDRETTTRRANDRPAALGACFHDYAKRKIGINLKQLAHGLRMTMRFLREIDSNPSRTPADALDEVARRAAEIGLDREESRCVLGTEPDQPTVFAQAASGADGFRQATEFSYAGLVESCFREDHQEKALWLSFAR